MITLAVLAILVLMSYPSYQTYLLRSRRLDAKMALLALEVQLKQDLTKNFSAQSPSGFYHLEKITQSPTEYILIAVPVGQQKSDPCGSFTLTSTHLKSAQKADCW